MSGCKFSARADRGGCGLWLLISRTRGTIGKLSPVAEMEKAEKRLRAILKKANQWGVSPEMLAGLGTVKSLEKRSPWKIYALGLMLTFFLLGASVYSPDAECLIRIPVDSAKIFREPENCRMCIGVSQADKVKNISPSDLEENYVETGKPVVVVDGTRGWSAMDLFDFEFFKLLYLNKTGSKAECQFFPYKTEFASLRQALKMSPERARLEPGTAPWYIGWSNCNDDAGKVLRKHYDRPYFLPDTSENIALSWIFMGGPGDGAHMHVDNVHYPSWQAQLRGRKIWRLAPPPECLYSCQEFRVTVEPGEIIVVDTNRWYHQTHILPGDISITIGSEFD